MVHRGCEFKIKSEGAIAMMIRQLIYLVLGGFLLSGCGDQFWCGDDGCSKRCNSQRCINSDGQWGYEAAKLNWLD